MDIFEKQQTIEAIRTVIKARWFFVLIIVLQALMVKIFFQETPLASTSLIFLVVGASFLYNFIYWLYLRRSPEKVNDLILKIIKFLQVFLDQLSFGTVLYFSGTANKMLMITYFIIIMISMGIHERKGIILTTLSGMAIYDGLVAMEYYRLMPQFSPEVFSTTPWQPLAGNPDFAQKQIIAFSLYLISAAMFAIFLGDLFKKREKRLADQRDDLIKKSGLLTVQAQELTKTKDYLHEALTKSDKARGELEKTKTDLEKANLELKAKLDEVEKYGKVTVGRELKMVELKEKMKSMEDRIKELEEQLGKD